MVQLKFQFNKIKFDMISWMVLNVKAILVFYVCLKPERRWRLQINYICNNIETELSKSYLRSIDNWSTLYASWIRLQEILIKLVNSFNASIINMVGLSVFQKQFLMLNKGFHFGTTINKLRQSYCNDMDGVK